MAYEIPVNTLTDEAVVVSVAIDTFSVNAYVISEDKNRIAIVVDLGQDVGGVFRKVATKTLIITGATVVSTATLPTTGAAWISNTRTLMKKIIDDYLDGLLPQEDTQLVNGTVLG